MESRRIYVAGPLTVGDVAANMYAAILEADKILDAGMCPFVPHLSHFWNIFSPRVYEEWLVYDLQWVTVCQALRRLPGPSPGADREVQHALEHNIPVYYSTDLLIADFQAGKF